MLKFLLICTSLTSVYATAADFSQANELFRQRENNIVKIHAARELYRKLLPNTTSAEKIFAVEQMSRLSLYQGLIEPQDSDKIKSAEICLNDIEQISSVNGATPVAYYYWKAVCLMGWARSNGVMKSLGKSKMIADLIDKTIATDAVYEGGGGYRLGSALYMALPIVNPIFLGLNQDLSRSLKYAELAIKSPAYSQEPDPETATGDYFFKVYEAKAQAQFKSGNRQGALKTIGDAIARIDEGDIPVGREPETAVDRRDLQILLDEYQSF